MCFIYISFCLFYYCGIRILLKYCLFFFFFNSDSQVAIIAILLYLWHPQECVLVVLQPRWRHPLCLSQCPWTKPCPEVAARSGGPSEPRRSAASPAALPLRPSPEQLGRTTAVDVGVFCVSPAPQAEAAGAGRHHPTKVLWHGPGWTGFWSHLWSTPAVLGPFQNQWGVGTRRKGRLPRLCWGTKSWRREPNSRYDVNQIFRLNVKSYLGI